MKYAVIGYGPYGFNYYGSYPTLLGAKRVAGKHKEYHFYNDKCYTDYPEIYLHEDTVEEMNSNGKMSRWPMVGAMSVSFKLSNGGWLDLSRKEETK